ncbi:hypothetical protein E6C27_scaffold277G002860 [Cucumis melo var. makuwa]|uniref:Uncharacterized protein n=1 Tax=Cucumis melo var. makuwa TaxID=1194695 RepID=A0A5A7T2D2_CUCMM|nr:hypothetical protein E6C27_scaffold277G002860 [Cucumis melo var. makuwa]
MRKPDPVEHPPRDPSNPQTRRVARVRKLAPRSCSSSRAISCFSSLADPPVLEPSVCSGPFTPILEHLGPIDLERWIPQQGHKRCNLDLGTSLLGKHTCLAVRIRRANLQVLPRDTEDQIFVPTGAHVARVREHARDWVEAEVGAKASWRATKSDRGEP